jgi:hypothetical protein
LRIKNKDIEGIIKFLQSISPLPAQQARKKVKFIKMCLEHLQDIEDERKVLIEQFGDRDSEGNLIIEDNSYKITKYLNEFSKEYNALMNEDWVIDETESVKDVLVTLRDLLLNYNKEISTEHEIIYDNLCEALEQLSY